MQHLTGVFFVFVLQEEIIPIFSTVRCLYIWWSAPNEQASKIWTAETTSALVHEPCRLQVGVSSHPRLLTVVPEKSFGFFRCNSSASKAMSSPRNGLFLVLLSRAMSWSTPHHWNGPPWLAGSYSIREERNQWCWRIKFGKKKSEDRRKSTYHCSKFTTQTTNGNKHIKMLVLFSCASWY